MRLIATLAVIGLATFALRLALIGAPQWRLPAALGRALRFVPVAVLTAIIVPEILRPGGQLNLAPANPRLWAGLLAVIIAWRTRSVLLTIALGMATLWLLQALAGS